jgi:hypothetical protein
MNKIGLHTGKPLNFRHEQDCGYFFLTGLLPAAIICLVRPDEHLASFGQSVQITASRTFN